MRPLLQLIQEKKLYIIISIVLASFGSLMLIVPFALIFKLVKYYVQFGAGASPGPALRWLGIAFGALVIRYALVMTSFVFSHIAAFDLLYEIRIRLTTHIGTLPMGFWGKKNSGQMLKIVQEDVESIEHFIGHYIPDTAAAFVLPFVTLAYLFTVDWRLTLAAAIPLPVTVILLHMMWNGILTGQNRAELRQKYHESMENMHSTMFEFVQGMPVVKVFNMTVDSFTKLKDPILNYRDLVVTWSRGISPYRALIATFVQGGGLFMLPLGLYLLQSGQTDVPTIILFMLLGTGCCSGLVNAVKVVSHMELIGAGIKRINGVLAAGPLPEPARPTIPQQFGITLRKVGFQYTESGPEILKSVNMRLPEGSFNAFVGPSGSGKTTLVNLIARMWDVTDGSISIGGIPLKEIGSSAISDIVGTVFQDVQMLTDTVEANIRMNHGGASRDEIEAAAKAAACHRFIMELPHGYETVIGDGGEVHLSGGERQRIALARVILKNPPIILLDEATAYADAENETLMQEAFSRLMHRKTIIVIAHRLSTIVKADNIFVIEKGQVAERGRHQELLTQKGLYETMWTAHTRAKEWNMTQQEVFA